MANDKYRASLRSSWISDPADTTLSVDAIPTNVPTYVVVGWDTQYETLFKVTGTSGTNSSNYALTGLTVIKGYGATGNLPEQATVNCLNNEEFFNQYSTAINDIEDTVAALEATVTGYVVTLSDGATPALDASLGQTFVLTAAGDREIAIPTNPVDKQKITIVHIASAAERTLTLNSGTGGFLFGTDITELTATPSGETDFIGCIYDTTLNKWCVVAYTKGF